MHDVDRNMSDASVTTGIADILKPYAIWAELSDEEVKELESAVLSRSEN